MAARAMSITLVVAGFAVALLLAILGVDLIRACRTGPQWKRRLVGAGLVLLMALGFAPASGCNTAAEEGTPAAFADPATPAKELSESKGWQRILAAWNEAEEIASGKRGDYPFDEKGKKQALANLTQAEADAADLQKAKLITEPEAGLLLKDLAVLTAGVQAKRPTEMKMATCYEPMRIQPGHDSFQRLSDRLPLLEKLAAAETLRREVVEKVLVSIEADIATLAKEESLKEFSTTEKRQAAEKTREAAKAAAQQLRRRIQPPVMCYARALETLPEPKREQSAARLKILETPAATAALRPDVLRKAAANAQDGQDAS
jgi:hypothetical protein